MFRLFFEKRTQEKSSSLFLENIDEKHLKTTWKIML